MKKIALVGSDKQTAENLIKWCREEGYEVSFFGKLDPAAIRPEEFDMLLVDIHPSGEILSLSGEGKGINSEIFNSLIRLLKSEPQLANLHIVLITPKKAVAVMVKGIEAGVDDAITEFSDKQAFLEDIKKITAKLRPGHEKVRLLDLNLINFFLKLFPSLDRAEFFLLAPVILNAAIIRRVMPYVGETTIAVILKRLQGSIGKQEEFMRAIKFEHGQILMDEVEKNSKEVRVSLLCSALRNYIYAFVQLTRTLTSDILIERWDWMRE